MTLDPLDSLLESSAPDTLEADATDLRAMVSSAAQQARPVRHRRIGLAAGLLSLTLVGGAGVAAASSTWLWGEGMEPHRSYTYASPTWGECELRLGNFVAENPFRQFELDRVIDDWFATADVAAEAEPFVAEYLDVLRDARANDPEPSTDPRLPDLDYWTAVDQAVSEALLADLAVHGFGQGSVTSSASQVHCEGEQWG
ncbi:MAG: hypothetical protein AAGC61_10465 [Microbacterium sp.]